MNGDPQSYVYRLAQLVYQTQLSDFNQSTQEKARIHILDTLGVMIAGASSPETQLILASLAHDLTGSASIVGHSEQGSGRDAALINGISAHALELDDSGGCDHSGAVVLPAVLSAIAQTSYTISGAELLRSVMLGYEVGRRVLEATGSYEAHNAQGWHSTGTCGVFGAAVAAGILFQLTEEEMSSALGIAASFAAGTWAFIHDGSPTKKLHAGRASEGGFLAALLASQGMQGPHSIFESEDWGNFLTVFNPGQHDAEQLIADWGANWRINRCSIKPYATCRGTHSAIDSLDFILQENQLDKQDIAQITVHICPFQAEMCAGIEIQSRAQAQMSIAYALSAYLEFNQVGLAQLDNGVCKGDWLAPWLARISFVIDDSMAEDSEPMIDVLTLHNQSFKRSQQPLGSPLNPLSMAQIIRKFNQLTQEHLALEDAQALIDHVRSLETLTDAQVLLPLLTDLR